MKIESKCFEYLNAVVKDIFRLKNNFNNEIKKLY